MIFPCIQVCDIETTIHWYSDFLGFECTFKSTVKNPEYATLEKGVSKLYLRKAPSSDFYASNIVVIETPELAKELDILSNKGVIVVQQISEGIFGTKEFIIKDYEDNNVIYKQRYIQTTRITNKSSTLPTVVGCSFLAPLIRGVIVYI